MPSQLVLDGFLAEPWKQRRQERVCLVAELVTQISVDNLKLLAKCVQVALSDGDREANERREQVTVFALNHLRQQHACQHRIPPAAPIGRKKTSMAKVNVTRYKWMSRSRTPLCRYHCTCCRRHSLSFPAGRRRLRR